MANAEVDDDQHQSILLPWPSSWTSPWSGPLMEHLLEETKAWACCFALPLCFHSLKFFCTSSSLGFICYWKLYLSELGFALKENSVLRKVDMLKSRKWWLLNPFFASTRFHCNWSSSGIGPVASVSTQLRLPEGSWTHPRTTWRWCRSWWSSHCWEWYTGAGSHSLPWWT